MIATPALRSVADIESFITGYYAAWGGKDEDRILSYYADNVTVQIPGSLMQGRSAVREQFVRPFITAFPGNRHFVKNIVHGRDAALVEFTFEAEHRGPFAGHAATHARIELPGCGVYDYDPTRRQITSARIYFDVGTLLKQIIEQRGPLSRTEEAAAAPTGTSPGPVEHLDLAAVITASQRMLRREEVTRVALETVAEGGPLGGMLDFLCRTMEEESLDRVIACIHCLNEDATMFCGIAAPSLDKSYREATNGVLVSSMIGPCCHAAATRQTVVVPEVAADPRWVKFREFADPLGLRSCLSKPIFSNEGKVLGTFALYYFEARDPSPRDERMVELLTRAAAVAIERSRAEAALRELNETLEQRVQAETRERLQIWNVSQDLLVIAGLDGTYLSVNPAWTATLGWSEADLLGKSSQWLLHPDDREGTRAELDHLASGHKTLRFENRIRAKDGSYRWISWNAAPDSGRIYAMGRDITEHRQAEDELRKMEAQLLQAQRLEAMGTLAGGIAHDFNNILGAILGYGEMALRDAKKGTRLRRDVDSIMAAGERGRALVDRVLAFSRSGVGERVPVHVDAVVREALDQVAAKLPRNVTVTPRLSAGRAAMLGDPTQVHQVIMNLASNAVQAMPRGGTLRVALETATFDTARPATVGSIVPGEYIVLRVSDTGTGIPDDVLEHMFDPFFTTKEAGVGSGLGLSLVHGIVTNAGGAIDVATKPGKGTTFTVYLRRTGIAPERRADESPPLPRGEGQRVLVVDDEEPLVRLATETLEHLGYTPVGFTSSTAALAAFRADPRRFDAVLTDERMPVMSGSALIREVRGIRGAIPVVLMSGYLRADGVGADVVVKKPLLARDLAASIARALHP